MSKRQRAAARLASPVRQQQASERTLGSPGPAGAADASRSAGGAADGVRQPENCGSRSDRASDQRALPAGALSSPACAWPAAALRTAVPRGARASPRHCARALPLTLGPRWCTQ